MKHKIFVMLLSLVLLSVFVCCGNRINSDKEINNQAAFRNSINSISIFEEGWEEWSTIVIFKSKTLHSNTSKIYSKEMMLSGHGGGLDSFLLSPKAFDYLSDYISSSNIHKKIPYWDSTAPTYTLFIIAGNDVQLVEGNKYGKREVDKGYTFFPDETIKYYTEMKNILLKSIYKEEYIPLIKAIEKMVLPTAERQKELIENRRVIH